LAAQDLLFLNQLVLMLRNKYVSEHV